LIWNDKWMLKDSIRWWSIKGSFKSELWCCGGRSEL
jgi:hypothetical protein